MLKIQEKISLAPLTSFRIGGDSDFYVEVTNVRELKEAVEFAQKKNIDFYILGGGTNLLVSDEGFRGIIIRIKMNGINIENNEIVVEAGTSLIKAINFASENGLSGMEKMAGIPGTIGGAIRGNAGAFGVEIKSVLKSVVVFNSKKMELEIFENAQCDFGYRSSIFKKSRNLIIVSANLMLVKGDKEEIAKLAKDTILLRASKGLHGVKSAGSFFMNPIVENDKLCGDFEKNNGTPPRNNTLPAGWVIDQANLRGKKIGGAQISEKHANYLINAGDATASDVVMLASFVKQQVRDQFGVQLQEEINYLGF